MKRPIVSVIAAITVMVAALSACGSSGSGTSASTSLTDEPAKGGTINVLLSSDYSYLDPAKGFDGGVNNFYRLVYRTLTTAAPGNAKDPSAVVPDMATNLGKVSDHGLKWTFKLKDGLKFDNGDPITSKEVKFGISRSWDPAIGIGSPYAKQVIAAPDGYKGPYRSGELSTIKTPDAHTIVFTLKKPYPDFPAVLAQPNMVPFPVGTGKGNAFLRKIIASGPYTLDAYTPGQSLDLKRNPNWDQSTDDVRTAKPDKWHFTIGLEGATIDERMLAGQGTDANAIGAAVQNATVARLQDPKIKQRVFTPTPMCTTYMSLNTTRKPLNDLRVRQAIEYAVDKTAVQNASGGSQLAEVADTILPASVGGHVDYNPYPRNIKKAKQLLAEAGYPEGFDLTLDTRSTDKITGQSEAIQNSLKDININVKLNVIDTSTYYETIGTISQQHDAALTGWCPDWASSAATFIPPLFDGDNIQPKGNTNLAQIDDPEINTAIDKAMKIDDRAKANEAWGNLDKLVMSKAPIVPLVWEKGLTLVGSNVTGLWGNPGAASGGIDYVLAGLRDPTEG